jgi:hypothetical protein
MADAGPSLHRNESGSSRIFAYAALTLYWAFLSGVASALILSLTGIPTGCWE